MMQNSSSLVAPQFMLNYGATNDGLFWDHDGAHFSFVPEH